MGDTFYFDPLSKAEVPGFRDSLIYNFSGDILYNLTRESIQNIVDAKKDPESEEPVKAVFKMSSIPAQLLPNSAELKKILESCWREQKKTHDQGIDFFKNAYNLINDNKTINILEISDYNTTGLFGAEDDTNGTYYKLMINIGSSNKGPGSGGSYGFGKGAYFTSSLFRTIFASSVYDEGKVFQGKLRLVPHEWSNRDGVIKRSGIGLYKYPAIRKEEAEIPEMFRRSEEGTSIFIVGFNEKDNWKTRIIESVIRYFWLSIIRGQLEVEVGGEYLSAINIESKIEKYFSNAKAKDIFNPIPFYKAYVQGEVKRGEFPDTIGNVELRLFFDKNFQQRIEYFRGTGMVIQNLPEKWGKGFAGVFFSKDENGVLRRMEDPKHEKWGIDESLTTDPEERKLFVAAKKDLEEFIEKSISELIPTVNTVSSTIKDLDKYFYSPAEENERNEEGNPESIEGQVVKEQTGSLIRGDNILGKSSKINIQVKVPFEVPGTSGGEGQGGGKGGGEGTGPGTGHPDDEGTTMIKINKNIRFKRSYAIENGEETEHIVFITGQNNDKFNMEVKVGTEDSYDAVDIKEVIDEVGNKYKISKVYNKDNELHRISVDDILIPETGNLKFTIVFATPGKYSLNLKAYENQ